jgi:hypothetical protein
MFFDWFCKKWVRTGRLTTIEFEDKLGMYVFLRPRRKHSAPDIQGR